jgi:hypothetical protein
MIATTFEALLGFMSLETSPDRYIPPPNPKKMTK